MCYKVSMNNGQDQVRIHINKAVFRLGMCDVPFPSC